jgi:hypothetical protein
MLDDADLDAAVATGLIDSALRSKLDSFALERRGAAAPAAKFDPVHVLYYAGALIVIGAMGLFATTAFEALGGWGLFGVAVGYAAGLTLLGDRLWRREATRIPGGLLIAAAVSMAPLAIYGVQAALNLWTLDKPNGYADYYPLINGSWIYMDLGAMAASAAALRRYPFSFIVLVGAVATWFLSMDLAAVLIHHRVADWQVDWELRRTVSEVFGAAMIALAWALDLRTRADFGFWLHLFGAMTLWGAVTASEGGGDFARALYCGFNVLFIALGLFLNRRVYAVFGAIGVSIYLGYLAARTFNDTLSFTFALTAIGLGVVFAGVALERRRQALSDFFDHGLPASLRALRPR